MSKIKSIEGSGAVGGLVVMFAALLADREGLFTDNYPHLGFGRLLAVDLQVGIDDSMWRKRDSTEWMEDQEDDSADGLIDDEGIGPLFQQVPE